MVTINDKHPGRLARDMIQYPDEVIHPEILTPSGSSTSIIEKVDESDDDLDEVQSVLDESASLRVLWDKQDRNHQRPGSIASLSSFRSHFTKKTG